MIFQPIPRFTIEDNASYETKCISNEHTYIVKVVIDELNDNLLVLRGDIETEFTSCSCKGFNMTKTPKCKHIITFLEDLKARGVTFREE